MSRHHDVNLVTDALSEACSLSRPQRLAVWSGLLLPFVAILAFSLAVSPEALDSHALAWYPQCAYRSRTGRDCPTCGITRAFCAFSHGDFKRGIEFQPAAALPYGVCIAGSALYLLGLPWVLTNKLIARRNRAELRALTSNADNQP